MAWCLDCDSRMRGVTKARFVWWKTLIERRGKFSWILCDKQREGKGSSRVEDIEGFI